VRRREWLSRGDADERRDTDDADAIDADAIDSDGDRSDAIDSDGDRSHTIDPDCHGVPNDNGRRGIPATGHDNGLRRHDNVGSQSRRGRGGGRGGCRGVAGRGIEQHAVGLDRIRDSRRGGHHRRDHLVVA
jgi:hypothetical protein